MSKEITDKQIEKLEREILIFIEKKIKVKDEELKSRLIIHIAKDIIGTQILSLVVEHGYPLDILINLVLDDIESIKEKVNNIIVQLEENQT